MINIFELPASYTITFIVMAFILGSVIGSFLNVVILRTPLKQSIVTNRSHCMSCGTQLKNIDLIPIFSYIFLGGKCRFCKARISPRYWIVELTTAVMYTLSICFLGISTELIYALILFPVLIVASGIDIDTMEIPYLCSIITAVLGIISIFTDGTPWYEHLIGAAIVGIPFAILALFGGMGGGDVQLMAAAGLLLGWRAVPAAAIGIILGAIGGCITLLSVPKKLKKETSEAIEKIATEWYEIQKENGVSVADGKADALYGNIFKGKSDIDENCPDEKIWSGKPDIKALNEMINELNTSDFSISIIVEGDKIKSTSCKKQIVFGPYLSVGIASAFLFGEQIINWYLSLI